MIPIATRDFFCCPVCQGALTWLEQETTCPPCAKRFPIDGSMIDFLEAPELDPLTNRLEAHYNQRAENNATQQGEMEVWALLPANAVGVAIDVGCGMGNKAVMLAKKAEWLICVDLARSSLELAREQLIKQGLADQCVFIVANATAMPIRTGVIDLAVCTEVIEHIEAPATLVAELHRVVKTDGALVLSAPNYANVAGIFKRAIDVWLYKGHTRWSPFGVEAFERHITTFATQQTFHEEGWQIDAQRGADFWFSVRPLFRMPLILLINAIDWIGPKVCRILGLERLIRLPGLRQFALSQSYRLRRGPEPTRVGPHS